MLCSPSLPELARNARSLSMLVALRTLHSLTKSVPQVLSTPKGSRASDVDFGALICGSKMASALQLQLVLA